MSDVVKIALHGPKGAGKYALIDASDFPELSKYKWYLRNGYACTVIHRKGTHKCDTNRSINISMHRLIMDASPDQLIDHLSRDRLDNRRSNLRFVSLWQNNINMTPAPGVSNYIGVIYDSKNNTYAVVVSSRYFGKYKDPVIAAKVRDRVARLLRPNEIFPVNFEIDDLPPDFKITNISSAPRKAQKRSSVSGVSWLSSRDKWRVIVKGKTLKYFDSEAEAIAFRMAL